MALYGPDALPRLHTVLLDEFSGVGEVASEGVCPRISTPLKDDGGHDATTCLVAFQGVLLSPCAVCR